MLIMAAVGGERRATISVDPEGCSPPAAPMTAGRIVPIVLATGMIKPLLLAAGVFAGVAAFAAPAHADPDTDPTMQNIGFLDTLNKNSIRYGG
jgi:hypothetical protein